MSEFTYYLYTYGQIKEISILLW